MNRLANALGGLAASFLAASSASAATTIFSENFETARGGVQTLDIGPLGPNGNSVGGFNNVVGSVDYLRVPNEFGFTCNGGSSGCVDLDGSRNAGSVSGGVAQLQTDVLSLAAGNYTLTFAISGGQWTFTSNDTVRVSLGSFLDDSVTLNQGDGWRTLTYNFIVAFNSTAQLIFSTPGVNDNVGLKLDDVFLVFNNQANTTVAPVPAALPLLLTGLASFGFASRRRRKA